MAAKGLEKTLQKLRRSLDDGQFYEAHQMYRTASNRYVKQQNFSDAKTLVYAGARELLERHQVGSGVDLVKLLLDLYEQSKPLLELAKLLDRPEDGLQRNEVMLLILKWSAKIGYWDGGDPVLHHEYGVMLRQEGKFTEAETHFIQGTFASARELASMLEDWSREETKGQHSFSSTILYLNRVLLRYINAMRLPQAQLCFDTFVQNNSAQLTVLETITVGPENAAVKIFQHPLINFMQLLLLCAKFQSKDAFASIKQRYGELLKRVYPESEKLLNELGNSYFGIAPPQQQGQLNLGSILGAMFGSGGGM